MIGAVATVQEIGLFYAENAERKPWPHICRTVSSSGLVARRAIRKTLFGYWSNVIHAGA